jgi:hypothetical protein
MAFSGSLSSLFSLRPASIEEIGAEDLLVQIGTGTLGGGTLAVPTKLTWIDATLCSYMAAGALAAADVALASTIVPAAASGTITFNGMTTNVFSYMLFGRVVAQL